MVKPYAETHQQGYISIENVPESLYFHFIRGKFDSIHTEGDLGIQIADDGRVWICIDGIAFIRFKPKASKQSTHERKEAR